MAQVPGRHIGRRRCSSDQRIRPVDPG
jgi:hypothetical protein